MREILYLEAKADTLKMGCRVLNGCRAEWRGGNGEAAFGASSSVCADSSRVRSAPIAWIGSSYSGERRHSEIRRHHLVGNQRRGPVGLDNSAPASEGPVSECLLYCYCGFVAIAIAGGLTRVGALCEVPGRVSSHWISAASCARRAASALRRLREARRAREGEAPAEPGGRGSCRAAVVISNRRTIDG
jgi:hypothetical protein